MIKPYFYPEDFEEGPIATLEYDIEEIADIVTDFVRDVLYSAEEIFRETITSGGFVEVH